MSWRRTFPGRPDQIPLARQFAMFLFADTSIASDVGFVVTELASNAVRHTRSGQQGGQFTVEVVLGGLAYVGVSDLGGGGYPTVRYDPLNGPVESEGKRGLRAVSQLAAMLGVHGDPMEGHTVWADLVCVGKSYEGPTQSTPVKPAT
ncbi:ATP-binding protein [Actinomadura terrae]|uniref:ATP-binding protein n=1 Tax=Actinomadura terrae TaxID=604353 RepID=UPI001FA80560|nr:ATP-binding protein [Actinomadura terrae]